MLRVIPPVSYRLIGKEELLVTLQMNKKLINLILEAFYKRGARFVLAAFFFFFPFVNLPFPVSSGANASWYDALGGSASPSPIQMPWIKDRSCHDGGWTSSWRHFFMPCVESGLLRYGLLRLSRDFRPYWPLWHGLSGPCDTTMARLGEVAGDQILHRRLHRRRNPSTLVALRDSSKNESFSPLAWRTAWSLRVTGPSLVVTGHTSKPSPSQSSLPSRWASNKTRTLPCCHRLSRLWVPLL
jgi:hypothetical protein